MADEILKPIEVQLDPVPQPKPDESKPVEVKVDQPTVNIEPGIDVLKAQLADLERREKQEREARAETDQVARQREQELTKARAETEAARSEIVDTRYQVILNSMDAINRDAEIAQRDYAMSLSSGNFEASAEAQRRIARAEAQLLSLEGAKSSIEEHARQVKEQPKPQPVQQQQTPTERFETYLAQFSPRAQSYLRTHPEFATDQRLNNRLLRVHGEAVEEQGLQPDSDAYYRYIDDRMSANQASVPAVGNRYTPPAAPVSRSAFNGSTGGSVTLSPAEREAARISGISEVEYARQMLAAQTAGEITRH